jgi:hypothetical protein
MTKAALGMTKAALGMTNWVLLECLKENRNEDSAKTADNLSVGDNYCGGRHSFGG